MNAEYQSHERIRQMLKPSVDIRLDAIGSLAWVPPLTLTVGLESLNWLLASMDPATVAHGVRELASPLSE
jgi:hypothetical protein